MRPSFKTIVSTALPLILTACGTLPAKKSSANTEIKNIMDASADLTPRAQADYNFILGELYGREEKPAHAIEHFEKVLALDANSATVHMRLSAEYLNSKNITKAIYHAEQAVAKAPRDIEAHLFLGGLYSSEKLYDQAIAQYGTVLKLQPKNTEAPVYIGSLYADKKDYKKAEHYFKSLLQNPNYTTPHVAHYSLGLIYLGQEQKKDALAAENAFKKALKIKSDYEDAALSLANLYLQSKSPAKALAFCVEFQKQNGFNQNIANLITESYIESGDSEKASAQIEFVAGNAEPSLETQMKMALLLLEQKNWPQAGAKLKEIVAKSLSADGARYYLAAVYEETGAKDDAIQEYLQVPSSSPHFSDAIVHAAHLLKSLGKLNQALDITEMGLKAKAGQPQVYTMHASLLEAKSDYLGATRALEQGLKRFSQNTGLLFQHALMLDRLGKKDDMMAQMKKVLEVEPNHVQGLSYLAFTLAELNQQLPEAEGFARRASELQPTDGYVLDTLGWVLFKQKKFPESIQVLEKAHDYNSSASIIAEHLADAYSMQSMTEKAKEMYKKAAELATNKKRAGQIRGKIVKMDFSG